jgi:Skp family chaperone for outer membrane proteins
MRTVLALAVLATAAAAHAQETPRTGRVARICLIDIDRIGAQSLLGKSYNARIQALKDEIEAARASKQAELQKMDGEIKALQEGLDKQSAFLSEDAAERKRLEITKKTRDRQAFVDDGTAEIDRRRQRAQAQGDAWNAELRAKIQPHLEAVARAQGFDVLLDARNALAVDASFDISNDVIARLDEAERAASKSAAK